MASVEASGISVGELAHALRSVDPRVVLVPPRILRRVLRGVLGIDSPFGQCPAPRRNALFAREGFSAVRAQQTVRAVSHE